MIEKITNLTSKDLLIEMCGHNNVYSYEVVKAKSMAIGHEMASYLIRAVGGTVGGHNDAFDGFVDGENYEFCLDRRSKNSSGHAADQARAPGRCVQILGRPAPGRISAEEFLAMHECDPEVLLDAIEDVRSRHGLYGQLRFHV